MKPLGNHYIFAVLLYFSCLRTCVYAQQKPPDCSPVCIVSLSFYLYNFVFYNDYDSDVKPANVLVTRTFLCKVRVTGCK